MAKRKVFAMKSEYRSGMIATVTEALAGIEVEPESVGPHLDGTVTVQVSESDLEAMRAHYGESLVEYTVHANSGRIRVSFPESEAFFAANSPVLTEEERAARAKRSGSGQRVDREAAERRKRALEARRARLAELHGVDLNEVDEE